MRFESVRAHHFGPFHNKTLDLAPGMNVVYGPNEAGKSSWHAALYVGLCGLQRGRGQPVKDAREFAARHRPWDNSSAWEAGAVVTLADGRRVELRHDLAGRVDSSAQDAEIAGKDYSGEIIFERAPDGSRWLGLNRKSFLSTACIRQADILRILSDANSLQEDMQRAAATAGTDATAAAALRRLNDYRTEHVGSSRAPTKPLRTTASAAATAKSALEQARSKHVEYMERGAVLERLEHTEQDAQREADAVRATLAEAEADAFETRLRRARELDELFPDGAPHPSPERDALAERVTAALTMWRNRPTPAELCGTTVEEIDQMIAESDAKLTAARAAVAEREAEEAERRLNRVRELDTLFPDGPPRASAADENLAAQVISALETWESLPAVHEPDGPSVEDIERELAAFDARVSAAPPASGPRRLLPLLVASCLAIVGGGVIVLALPDLLAVGAAVAGAGLAGVLAWLAMSRLDRQSVDVRSEVVLDVHRMAIEQRLDSRLREQERYESDLRQRSSVIERLKEAAAACGSDALKPEAQAQALRGWQDRRKITLREREKRSEQWDELQGLLAGQSFEEVASEAKRLRDQAVVLTSAADQTQLDDARQRNITSDEFTRLERESNTQRNNWENERGERRAAKEQQRNDAARVEAAVDKVRRAAKAAEVMADDEDGLAEALEKWQEYRKESIERAEQQGKDWDELQQLLGEGSLDEIEVELARLRNDATARVTAVGVAALANARALQPTQETLAALQDKADNAFAQWNDERVRLEEFEKTLPSVADAEDTLDAVLREQERVAQLDRTLDRTIHFLEQAQEQIHRNIAPILRSTVLEWLPRVTAGRYSDCRINPESLLVEISGSGGRWRHAQLLSHGTAEQTYLLLRLALSRHLTKQGEVCPLILDDVVSASDAERKRVVLETLLAISESTQVILFTHEDDVRGWARDRLAGPPNRLIELPLGANPAR